MKMHTERGVGMVEVLIAVLLLAIGVIGFAGLQVRAVTATGEAFQRGQAMVIARDLSDRMRANPQARAIYKTTTNWTGSVAMPAQNCLTAACTANQMATFDIYQIRVLASTVGANADARMINCAGNANVSCLYLAWNDTTPTNSSAASTTDCTVNGIYQAGSDCVMLETY